MLLLILAFFLNGGNVLSAGSTASRTFPAKIEIIESNPQVANRFTVRLTPQRGVDIYANQPKNDLWEHAAAKLTVKDVEGKKIAANIEYPSGTKIDTGGLGSVFVYRTFVDLKVTLAEPSFVPPLSLTMRGAGYNRLRASCLGGMLLTTVRK